MIILLFEIMVPMHCSFCIVLVLLFILFSADLFVRSFPFRVIPDFFDAFFSMRYLIFCSVLAVFRVMFLDCFTCFPPQFLRV